MTPSLPEGKALRCKLVRDVAGSDVEPDLRVVIAILIAQRSVNDRLCSLAGAVLNSSSAWGSSRCSECAVVLMLVLLGSNLSGTTGAGFGLSHERHRLRSPRYRIPAGYVQGRALLQVSGRSPENRDCSTLPNLKGQDEGLDGARQER